METWRFDALGNWTYYGRTNENPILAQVRQADAANQYTNIASQALRYNANGALTNYNGCQFTYDWADRLIEVRSNATVIATYTYDALNRRVSKTVGGQTSTFLYDGQQVIEERQGAALVRQFVYGEGVDTPLTMAAGTNRYYYLRDWMGNVSHLTSAGGEILETYAYTLYGVTTVRAVGDTNAYTSSPRGNPYGFDGRRLDPETGLYHYRNRAYDPGLGRFLQRDPAGYVDGLNLYAFARHNPVNFNDPYGLASAPEQWQYDISRQIFAHAHAFYAAQHAQWEARMQQRQINRDIANNRENIDVVLAANPQLHLSDREALGLYNNGITGEVPMMQYDPEWYEGQKYVAPDGRQIDLLSSNYMLQRCFVDYCVYGRQDPGLKAGMANRGIANPGEYFKNISEKAYEDEADDQRGGFLGQLTNPLEWSGSMFGLYGMLWNQTGGAIDSDWRLPSAGQGLRETFRHDEMQWLKPYVGTVAGVAASFIPYVGVYISPYVAAAVQASVEDRAIDYERTAVNLVVNAAAVWGTSKLVGGADAFEKMGMFKGGAVLGGVGAFSGATTSVLMGDNRNEILNNAMQGGISGLAAGMIKGYLNTNPVGTPNIPGVTSGH